MCIVLWGSRSNLHVTYELAKIIVACEPLCSNGLLYQMETSSIRSCAGKIFYPWDMWCLTQKRWAHSHEWSKQLFAFLLAVYKGKYVSNKLYYWCVLFQKRMISSAIFSFEETYLLFSQWWGLQYSILFFTQKRTDRIYQSLLK